MKYIIHILLLIQTFKIEAQFLFQVNKDTCIKWNYIDGDEFNSNTIDETKWHTGFPWSRTLLSEDIVYLKKNILLDSGLIKFRVNKEKNITKLYPGEYDTVLFKRLKKFPDKDGNIELDYTGGLIWSKSNYKYGYFEIRFKNPSNYGLWPAFWLYGEKTNEIDIMELKGEKNDYIHVDVHCLDGCNNYITGILNYRKSFGHWIKTNGNFSEEFTIVSGEWQPDYIKFYLNGNLIAYYDGHINVPMGLTAGNGKSHKGNGPFSQGGVCEKTIFPTDFTVDYIRVWSKDTMQKTESVLNKDFESYRGKKPTAIMPHSEKIKFKKKILKKSNEVITLSLLPIQNIGFFCNVSGSNKLINNFSFKLLDEKGGTIFEQNKLTNSNFKILLDKQEIKKIILKIKIDGKEYVQLIR